MALRILSIMGVIVALLGPLSGHDARAGSVPVLRCVKDRALIRTTGQPAISCELLLDRLKHSLPAGKPISEITVHMTGQSDDSISGWLSVTLSSGAVIDTAEVTTQKTDAALTRSDAGSFIRGLLSLATIP